MTAPSYLFIGIASGIWLCPLWLAPTIVVPSFLWAAVGLGLLLILDVRFLGSKAASPIRLQKLFLTLLTSLVLIIAWRSHGAPNTVAASLCLISIGLAATITAKSNPISSARLIAWGWLLAGLCNSIYGLVQYTGWTDEPLGMAFGFLRQRNNFATLCNISVIALVYLWHQRQLGTKLLLPSAFVLLAGLAATVSRAGLLELLAILFAMLWQRNLRYMAALFALVYGLLAAGLPQLIQSTETIVGRVSTTAQGGQFQDARRMMWDNTAVTIGEQPLLGVGWRGIDRALHLTDFGTAARFPGQVDNAHNLPLQFAAELGLPFTVLWFFALIWLILRNKPWQTKTPEQKMAWGILLVIAIHSLLEYPLWYAPFQVATGLAAGLLFVKKQTSPHPSSKLIPYGLVGVGLIIFSTYTAFDYHRVRQLFLSPNERSALYQGHEFESAKQSWLFAAQVRYARLHNLRNASSNHPAEIYPLAQEVFYFSAEPWVLQMLITSGEQLISSNPQIAADVAHYKRQLISILAADEAAGLPTLK